MEYSDEMVNMSKKTCEFQIKSEEGQQLPL